MDNTETVICFQYLQKAKKAQKRKLDDASTSDASNGDSLTHSDKNGLTNARIAGSKSASEVSSSTQSSKKATNGSASIATSSRSTNGNAASGFTNKEFDPKQSKVYKSLFLSKEDKDKHSAHWVTYNPYYAMSK